MEVRLRLKSASKACPMASCNKIPEPPAPITTGISPPLGFTALNKIAVLSTASRTIVEKLIERLNLNVEIIRNVEDADIVIAHKNFAKGGAKILSTAKEYRVQIFYVKTNSMAQIQKVLKDALDIQPGDVESLTGYSDEAEKALDEAKSAIKKVLDGALMIELAPQPSHIRKLQHELVEQYNLQSTSIGEEPDRHLRIEK